MPIQQLSEQLKQGRLSLTVMDDGSGVLLDVKEEALFSLNPTGLFLIQQLQDGEASLEMLAAALADQFQIDGAQARQDAEQFLNDLSAAL